MVNITEHYTNLYYPQAALVFYRSESGTGYNADMYVEYFDMDENGSPINAHPLTKREADRLAKALKEKEEKKQSFSLQSESIIDLAVLHINYEKARVIWFTRARRRHLFFTESLGIPSGAACVPPMLWAADRNSLSVFALDSNRRPTEQSVLYHAPFFNVYEDGRVCMGTVDVQEKKAASLEAFTRQWEAYFFNSYFSHLIGGHNPVKGNCVSLWKNLVETGKTGRAFPKEVLTPYSPHAPRRGELGEWMRQLNK